MRSEEVSAEVGAGLGLGLALMLQQMRREEDEMNRGENGWRKGSRLEVETQWIESKQGGGGRGKGNGRRGRQVKVEKSVKEGSRRGRNRRGVREASPVSTKSQTDRTTESVSRVVKK
jgi:hypothetical protein